MTLGEPMSAKYDTSTFSIESELVPHRFSSSKEMDDLRSIAYQRNAPPPENSFFITSKQPRETLGFVQGSTRNGWAIYTVGEVLNSMCFSNLEFLTDSGHQQVFEKEHCLTKITVLRDELQKHAIIEMHQLFKARTFA